MGIDSIWGAGQQGAQIFAGNDLHIVDLIRPDHFDLIHLIGKCPVQHGQLEGITQLHFVQFGKQLGMRQATVGGKNAVCAFTADGKRRSLQVAAGNVQHFRGYTVIQG